MTPDCAAPLRLPARAPFAGGEVLRFLASHLTPGVEEVVGGTYRRTVEDGGGILEVTPDPEGVGVVGDRHAAARLFDLDADWASIRSVLSVDPLLRPMVDACPGVRVPGSVDGFQDVVRTVLAQQVSTRGAATLSARLVRSFGEPLTSPTGALTHRFPTAVRIAAAGVEAVAVAVGMPLARARAVVAVATAVDDGTLDVSPDCDRDRSRAAVRALPGIGPWTEAIVSARVFGEPDALPASDLALRQRTGLDVRELTARAEAWRPWRSYATFTIWAYTMGPPGASLNRQKQGT